MPVVRLQDLAPKFWADDPSRIGQGLAFTCPHCGMRIAIAFVSPLDGSSPSKQKTILYGRRGGSFETLTISPTIVAPDHARIRIDNGEVDWTPFP